ncbi:4'-phosphopantetheinyl transferase superfamily protein [Actinoplanes oblitus]|uniref:4'-phosphopantetheinyl transferase superfamily protein n=1 Tax=Actinoplanes oblitus TaxID=3040509 RepID=A0ABY8W937_9ACTN|nr:4'-phosphopantetheinyl transferase superfamily protein [Actinoplanes oblitus]WIM94384.1 4'-phosphopantetheinyl transferase superfamily protein [Actinoplanes oblitus]
MIERLLPPDVVAVEAFADVPGEAVFPGEEDLVAKAVEGRRREFVTARRCAREALARLGFPPAPIRPDPRRAPQWPAGVIGSITHCAGYRAAVVARLADLAGVGIDAEPNEPLPDGVAEAVAGLDERDMVDRLARTDPSVSWDRLLFSAKESIYKAWYPLTRRWLGFEEARLVIDPFTRTFTGHLSVDGTRVDGGPPLTELRGRYLATADFVVTAVTVAHAQRVVVALP